MGLIKSANTPPSLTPFSLADIEKQARAILLRARAQAEQLLLAAQRDADDLRLAPHPLQIHVLTKARPKPPLRWPDLKHIELVEDETLAPGGCRIFTRHGRIDADLDGQLQRIAAELVPAPPDAQPEAREI